MRVMICFAAAMAAILVAAPVHGQTYDPRYPVCMQTYGPVGGINCSYTSMADCRSLAQGRGAQCVANPYFARKSRR
jgi:hypothetical protein